MFASITREKAKREEVLKAQKQKDVEEVLEKISWIPNLVLLQEEVETRIEYYKAMMNQASANPALVASYAAKMLEAEALSKRFFKFLEKKL
jgi:mannitol/fructose-specific phosphotransferase system IIA component (Ntr-type)